jgi:hypothetical protein
MLHAKFILPDAEHHTKPILDWKHAAYGSDKSARCGDFSMGIHYPMTRGEEGYYITINGDVIKSATTHEPIHIKGVDKACIAAERYFFTRLQRAAEVWHKAILDSNLIPADQWIDLAE